MIKVEEIDVYGFEAAIRGMRNPMNSWDKFDTVMSLELRRGVEHGRVYANVGPNDLDLMRRLYQAGTEHRKYLRMITVTMDITAPLYWWKEFDTYKVGTVCNSCSTMHKIHSKEFTLDDFSCEHLCTDALILLGEIVEELNVYRDEFNHYKNKLDWWQMIQLLPSSYNQKRTVQLSYETVFNIIRQREHHKLDEWVRFVNILKELPYVKELML